MRPVILRYPYKRFSPAWDSISGVSFSFAILIRTFCLVVDSRVFVEVETSTSVLGWGTISLRSDIRTQISLFKLRELFM